MGDAISHAAFPGVVAAYLLKVPFYLGAVVAAVGTALAHRLDHAAAASLRGDTAIGVLFAGMFALGVFMFSTIRNYVGDLFGFLFGEILAISAADLVALSVLGAIVLAIVAVLWKELLYATFDPLGAAASGLPGRRPRVPLPRAHRPDDRGQPPGGRDHPGRGDARDPGGDGPAPDRSASGGSSRIAVAIGVACPIAGLYLSFWLDTASGRDDRPRRDRGLPRDPRRRPADGPAPPAAATGLTPPRPPNVPVGPGPKGPAGG